MSVADPIPEESWLSLLIPQVPQADRARLLETLETGAVPDRLSATGRLVALEIRRGNGDAVRAALDALAPPESPPLTLPRFADNPATLKDAIRLAYSLSKRRPPTEDELDHWAQARR